MFTDLLQLLPQNISDGALIVAMVGTAIGAGLWVGGVKLSRPIVTLVTVLIGAAIGSQLPKWFSWNVSGAGLAVGAALVLGLTGFVLHRMWIGLSLGIVLALWAAFAIFLSMHDATHTWTWPAPDANATVLDYAKSVWATVPPNMARLLPFACGVALISAMAATIIWPKLCTAFHWSILGLSMVIGFGMVAIARSSHSNWMDKLPQKLGTQVGVVAGMLVVGTFLQWRMTRERKPSAGPKPEKSGDEQPALA